MMNTNFSGLRVVESVHAREDIGLFVPFPPPSRHRSKRVRKKLMRRAQTWVMIWEPVAYILHGTTLIVHPTIAWKFQSRQFLNPTSRP